MFEIGNSLSEARSRRGIEFAQAEQATKIRGRYLRALEDEQFDTLPSQTYVKGFLRTYADYLGLDGQLYVDEYNSRFVAAPIDNWERSAARNETADRDSRFSANLVVIALAVIATFTVIVIAAWKTSGDGQSVNNKSNTKTKTHVVAPPAATGYLEVTAVNGPSKVIVYKNKPGGPILFAGTLSEGDNRAFNGRSFWLNLGAPENLLIKVGGKKVHIAGYRPWVLTVTPAGWQSHPA
jgi:cytoskeletal protein RodZ